MDTITLLGIALALAMDAFAVALGVSISLTSISRRQYFRLSWHFGLFQFLLPLVGWLIGGWAASVMASVSHWAALVILLCLGLNMIRSACNPDKGRGAVKDPTRGLKMILLSLAVSIDAFAAGLSLGLLGADLLMACAVIGVVAGLMTLVGMRFGKFLGQKAGNFAEMAGGLVLIALGVKILLEN